MTKPLVTMANEHLIDAGCRRLALLAGRDGFRKALARHGLPISEPCMITREHGDNADDGVFCHNDPAAMGAMNAILEAGLRIPRDVGVIGCGNVRYADSLKAPLSSID